MKLDQVLTWKTDKKVPENLTLQTQGTKSKITVNYMYLEVGVTSNPGWETLLKYFFSCIIETIIFKISVKNPKTTSKPS